MTKLVVDTNVVIKWFVHEPLSVEARRILDEYQADKCSACRGKCSEYAIAVSNVGTSGSRYCL